jgi:hypothetical protein
VRRFLFKVWRQINPEIALGFVLAALFWIPVIGWQAAYAPTEMEKQKCQAAAHSSGHKAEECKTFWERTTSDPVAFFTLWLVVSTIGLGVSTVLLWYAGEKQLRHGRRSVAIQSKDMRASIALAEEANRLNREALFASQRPWLTVDVTLQSGFRSDCRVGAIEFVVTVKNVGKVPALNVICELTAFPNQEGGRDFDHYGRMSHNMRSYTALDAVFGEILFPDQTTRLSNHPTTAIWFDENIQTALAKRGIGPLPIEPLGVCVCVDYMSAVGDRHFQTGFVYFLIRETKEGEMGGFSIDGGSVPQDEILLLVFPDGHHIL